MPAAEVMQLASLLIGACGLVVLILNVVITLTVKHQSNSMKDELVAEVRKNALQQGRSGNGGKFDGGEFDGNIKGE